MEEGWRSNKEESWGYWSEKVRTCKNTLTRWHKATFKNAAKEIHKLKGQIQHCTNLPADQVDWNIVNSLRKEIDQCGSKRSSIGDRDPG